MYQIICSNDNSLYEAIQEVEAKVNKLKKDGWTEQGGVSISHAVAIYTYFHNSHHYTVAQAMVKNEE